MCNNVSGSFSLCFWRNLSLVKGAAEMTLQHEMLRAVIRWLQQGEAQLLCSAPSRLPQPWAERTTATQHGMSQDAWGRSYGSK